MQPYFHPTSIAIIDDDQNFLDSIAFYLSDDFLCKTYKLPEQGLYYIWNQEKLRREAHLFFQDPGDMIEGTKDNNRNQLIKWDASQIYNILRNTERFKHISVCIVDFDMPGMNGLEVCRQIVDLPVRKLLLTGKTGIDTAIRAFNEGIIDCFLMKQEQQLTEKIHSELTRLQKQYFDYVAELIKPVQCLNELHFLNDPGFHSTFEGIIHNRNIDEYYLSTFPSGMLLIQKDGVVNFLLVNTGQYIDEQVRVAEKLNAPEQLISMLKSRQILTLFPTANGFYAPEVEHDWSKYIWPAQKLMGKNTEWYLSFIDEDSLPKSLSGKVASFNDYVDELEEE